MIALALAGCSKSSGKNEAPAANNERAAANNGPEDIAIAVSEATSTRRDRETGNKLWEIGWKSANLGVVNGQQFGSMFEVKGSVFEKDQLAASFSSDQAEADKAEDRLILEGNVKITSLQAPKAVMTAKKVEWLPNLKVFKASGDVLVEGDQAVVGPMNELYTSPDLKRVGTSQGYFKK